jgi:DNA-binding transcriptional ArsR family regulator
MTQKNETNVFMAIADPTRRAILTLLTGGAMTVNALAGNFDISRPAVSKHIKILEEANLVHIDESGRERHCTLNREGFEEIKDWLAFYEVFWKSKLAKLGELLDERARKKRS